MSWWKPEPIEIDLSRYGSPKSNEILAERKKDPWLRYQEFIQRVEREAEERWAPIRKLLTDGDYSGYARQAYKNGMIADQIVAQVELHKIMNEEEE